MERKDSGHHEKESAFEATKRETTALLAAHGIPFATWGTGSAKTVDHLVKEIMAGETELVVDDAGELVRKLSVAFIDIAYQEPSGRRLVLTEEKQVFKDGRERRRVLAGSIAEKMKADEIPDEDMVHRALQEELGIEAALPVSVKGSREVVEDSPSYPGLPMRQTGHYFEVALGAPQYRSEGYVEHQLDKDTYFVWAERNASRDQGGMATSGKGAAERFLEHISGKESDQERRREVMEKCRRVVEKILEWAAREQVEIASMEKLGGGFTNVVLLIQTRDGRSLIAKGFEKEEEIDATKRAQTTLARLSRSDEKFIPEAVAWIDDEVLVSEKAQGASLRKILEGIKNDPTSLPAALASFEGLGLLLGSIHERSEKHISEYASEEIAAEGGIRKERHRLEQYVANAGELIDLSGSHYTAETLRDAIKAIGDPGYVSVIHADAHLDQFFHAPNDSLVTIVDYDSFREGDPMVDLGRILSSLRNWTHEMGIGKDVEGRLIQAVISGYRKNRKESGIAPEQEFDYKKVILYELRLYVVQLKYYVDARKKAREILDRLPEAGSEAIGSEREFYQRYQAGSVTDAQLARLGYSEKDRSDLKELAQVVWNIQEHLDYLGSMEVE